MPRSAAPSLLAIPLLAFAACRSSEEWRQHADDEVYSIVMDRRAELGAKDQFTIEPPVDPLRERLIAARSAGTEEPVVVGLVDCLRIAAENSREWQDQREQLYRVALALTLQRWNFSAQESATFEAFQQGVGDEVQREGVLSNFGLTKLLGIGTRITANVGLDVVRALSSGNGWDALSAVSLNITQPILRGFGRDIVMEPLTQAERNVLYQARAYERFRRTFAVDVAQSYFRVLEQMDRLRNEEATYANLTTLRERNEALGIAGRQTDVQVDQTRQDELSAEDRVVGARRDLEASLDALKFNLGLPIDIELVLEEGGLRSLDAWPALAVDLPEDMVLRLGLERRLDHATALDRVDDAERGAKVAADSLRTGLDFEGSAAVVSDLDDPGSLDADDIAWGLSLGLDLPLDRIPQRNAYRAALIELQASRRDAEASADRVVAELRDSLRSLEAARASYAIQSGSVVLAERRVESAALNLDAGRVSTRDVLDAQESLLGAQNTLAASLTDTILAGLFLYRDLELIEVTDAGVEVHVIDLADPGTLPPPPLPDEGEQP